MKFFRKMYQKSKEQKGFTLVEMIVVLVIIAILAAITIPALLKYIEKAKDKQVLINARTAYLAAETAASEAYAAGYTDNGSFEFTETEATEASGSALTKLQKVQNNATDLTGITDKYTCTVTTDSKNWKIKKVVFKSQKSDGTTDKTATLDLSESGPDWTVK